MSGFLLHFSLIAHKIFDKICARAKKYNILFLIFKKDGRKKLPEKEK